MQARDTEHLFWMLGQTSTRDFWNSECVMFYSKIGRQQFPWKELARKRRHCSVSWKTTLCQPAREEGKKEKRDQDTRTKEKQRIGKRRIQQEEGGY